MDDRPTSTDDDRRALALRDVTRQARAAEQAQRRMANAMRLARAAGCSLRDIADAADRPHMTVKRIIERVAAEPPEA